MCHTSGQILDCAYTICLYFQTTIFCTKMSSIFGWSPRRGPTPDAKMWRQDPKQSCTWTTKENEKDNIKFWACLFCPVMVYFSLSIYNHCPPIRSYSLTLSVLICCIRLLCVSSFIIAIPSSNGDSTSPWNMPLWICILANLFPFVVNSTLQVCMVCTIWSCILYILRQCSI